MRRTNTPKLIFLKAFMGYNKAMKMLILENFIVSVPFLLALFLNGYRLACLVVILISVLVALLTAKFRPTRSFPTPFFNYPFEFQIGYRQHFFLILFSYLFVVFSNQEIRQEVEWVVFLGIFALISTFYSEKIEDTSYIMLSKRSPRSFLLRKLGVSIFLTNMLILPLCSILIWSNFINLKDIIWVYFSGLLFLCFVILAKYIAFPNKINISQGAFIGLSVVLIPISIFTFPVFYFQAEKNLSRLMKND
ncbi:hypothetical protein ACFOUP_07160 [Belliella kenyensis]|uniref:ABC-2 family transporter protein n=2 Tax=Belliella kenyensis TaxID=1472724 RepID=A0ABV8EJF0_9BACT|nr:hypothetical protein [Belliella kenyensis]MCH7400250.1 hypothetical protein [Belliella kenyensis]